MTYPPNYDQYKEELRLIKAINKVVVSTDAADAHTIFKALYSNIASLTTYLIENDIGTWQQCIDEMLSCQEGIINAINKRIKENEKLK